MEVYRDIMSKIGAGIVSFNPEINRLKENIQSIIKQVESVLIVDNGSENISEVEELCENSGCELIKLDDNKGIAYALNKICKYFYFLDFEWVITLDQDSVSPTDIVSKMSIHISEKVGAIGPRIIYRHNERFVKNASKNIEEVDWLITSATLTNLSSWKEIGGFDNVLFIDGVDKDFCFRLVKRGYKILQCNDVELLHELGDLRCRKILGKTIYVTNHSPKRKYYMARNAVYLDKKNNTSGRKKYIIKLLIKTLLYESDKISKFNAIIEGINDGRQMCGGRNGS